MTNTWQLKRSSSAGSAPATLLDGEIAINTADKKLYYKDSGGTIRSMTLDQALLALAATTVSAGTGLTGGGSLAANRTLSANIATQAEAEAGTVSTKLMTPQRVAQAIAALGGGGGGSGLRAIIEDQKSSGTNGGSATTGAWYTRDLNTLVMNQDSVIASLASNAFTPSVDGIVTVTSTFNQTKGTAMRVYDVTASASAGDSVPIWPSAIATELSCFARVVAGHTYRIEYRCTYSFATTGLGTATSWSGHETYTRVLFALS